MTSVVASRFEGLPAELFDFLKGLEGDNSKTYWDDHREVWETFVQSPIQDLMADLEPQFGSMRTFRPQRDVRFSNDKSPYKTWVGVTTSERAIGGIGSFLRVESTGIRVACGAMVLAPDQLERFRTAIADRGSGEQFARLRTQLAEDGLEVGHGKADPLKRTPTGFPKDHPREDILRWKGAVVVKEFKRAKWMQGPRAVERVRDIWAGAAPLQDWIVEHVGESSTPTRRPGH